jgi:hypothetical protein
MKQIFEGAPPKRNSFAEALEEARLAGKPVLDKYLVGFDIERGDPLWVTDDEMCGHGCVFAKTGEGKTLWLLSLVLQQMLRGRASGATFIDAKRDSQTLGVVVMMALMTGRLEDLIVVDPLDPIHTYNFVLTSQRPDVKGRKILRAGLPQTTDQSVTKHYDRLAADSVYRIVRALDALGGNWSVRDVAMALSAFDLAYPHLKEKLVRAKEEEAVVDLSHLAATYRSPRGGFDKGRMLENLRGIASELYALGSGELGNIFCAPSSDLVLTDAIRRGKIIYFMLPRLEEGENAARMAKVIREDLEIAIGEITSSHKYRLEDPHLVCIDEGASTFGPTWANLFELARKGRFSILFGAQSTGSLTDKNSGLSESFYERVMANVNLKVMMRVGDNRTASDLAEWIGKAAHRGSDKKKTVSADDFKHFLNGEKGLAWFDLGNGRVVKGRTLWVDGEIPEGWDFRKNIPRFQMDNVAAFGLAEWLSKEIVKREDDSYAPQNAGNNPGNALIKKDQTTSSQKGPARVFKLTIRNKNRQKPTNSD